MIVVTLLTCTLALTAVITSGLGMSPTTLGMSPTTLGVSPTMLGVSPTMLGVSPTTPVDAVLYVAPGGVCGGVSPCYDSVPTAVAPPRPFSRIMEANWQET
ncbi:MAG: hypothetical protein IAE79_24895 [Anaerolinea sp.]|nr:hypothetical protein [Anaerolinea sp.]